MAQMLTYNYKDKPYEYTVANSLDRDFKDDRNGILCNRPTCDIECYINYINYLNMHSREWKNYGYLDLGMMPIAMAPAFLQQHLKPILAERMKQLGIPCYSMPAVSLMLNKCNVAEDDLWAFKSDVAKALGMREEEVSLVRLLERVF